MKMNKNADKWQRQCQFSYKKWCVIFAVVYATDENEVQTQEETETGNVL